MSEVQNEIGALISYGAVDALSTISYAKFRAFMLKDRLMTLMQAAQRVSMVGWGLSMIVRRQALLHAMEDNARLRLEIAQKNHLLTVAKYGPSSQEARESERTLSIAQNMQERSTMRSRMLIQMQYFQIFQMGIGVFSTLRNLRNEWVRASAQAQDARNTSNILQMAKNKRLVALRFALFAASLATSIAVNVLTLGIGVPGLDVATQAGVEMAPDEFHSGGVVGGHGWGYLERGETLNATKWFSKPVTILIKPPPGTPESEIARELFDKVDKLRGE